MGKDVQKIHIKDLSQKTLCEGHLFLPTKEGRRFYVLKPCMLIDESFIKRYAPSNTVFDYECLVDEELIQIFREHFRSLKYLQFEKDLKRKSIEIIAEFQRAFSGDAHFLSFALACFHEFSILPPEILRSIHDTDVSLFRKSVYSSALTVLAALTNDFYHFTMIRDLYLVTFTLDFGLCSGHYSYYVAEACNLENRNPGSGRGWMAASGASEDERRAFLEHPTRTYEALKTAGLLVYPELLEISLYQHELASGQGFPRGIPRTQISSWESIVILADAMVEIREDQAIERNSISYILSFENPKLGELPVQRAHTKLRRCLGEIVQIGRTGT